ncbi:MAG: repair protein MmcB-related protein [Cypionkella sp.]|nr:repair protein MmcB-related protein [Cypionkella sp.]
MRVLDPSIFSGWQWHCGRAEGLAACSPLVHILAMSFDDIMPPMPGQRLARGVCRALLQFNFVTVEELVPTPGLRVDVMALGPKGEVWIIECKSSRADYMADQKWRGYLEWCDRFFWAVSGDFPT